jgi:hypothetical protein
MKTLLLTLIGCLSLGSTALATTVQYTLSATANPNEYTALFTTNATLATNQAIVIRFPYASSGPTFASGGLSSPIGGIGSSLYLHQPNTPTNADGDLTVITISGPASVANFSVNATFTGGSFPGMLPFQIITFDGNNSSASVVSIDESGTATQTFAPSGVPEPSSILMLLTGLAAAGTQAARRRKLGQTQQI